MNSVTNSEISDASNFLAQADKAFAKQYKQANVQFQVKLFNYVDFNMASYLHTGQVVPLDDIISDALRNDIDDASWQMSEVNGKTYMMPFLIGANAFMSVAGCS